MDSNPQAAFPSLCSNGCGFFSTTDKEGLCSVCFKEKLKKEAESQSQAQGPPTTSSSTQTPPPPSEAASGSSTPSLSQQPAASTSTSNTTPDLKETTLSESVAENSNIVNSEDLATASETAEASPRKTPHPADEDSEPVVPAKKAKKNRCLSCKKKLGLTGSLTTVQIWEKDELT